MAQPPPRQAAWQFLRKFNTHSPCDRAISAPGVHPREMNSRTHTKTWTRMFAKALFVIDPKLETTRISFSRWVGKLIPCNEIAPRRKEQTVDTHTLQLGETQRHHAEELRSA